MLAVYRNMFRISDLRKKILFTIFIFAVYPLGASIPVTGVDLQSVETFADQTEATGVIGLLSLFSGGALEQLSVLGLGIMPYITASIIMQLLAVVIPRQRVRRANVDSSGVQKQRSESASPMPTPIAFATKALPKTLIHRYDCCSSDQLKPVTRFSRLPRRAATPLFVSIRSTLWPVRMP